MIFIIFKMIFVKGLMRYMGEIIFFRVVEVKGYFYVLVLVRFKMKEKFWFNFRRRSNLIFVD